MNNLWAIRIHNKKCMVSVQSHSFGSGACAQTYKHNKCFHCHETESVKRVFLLQKLVHFVKQTSQEADKSLILCCLLFMWRFMLLKCKVSINPNDCIKWKGDTGTKAWKFVRQSKKDPSSKMLKLLHSPVVCENGAHLSSLEYLYGACCFSSQQCY